MKIKETETITKSEQKKAIRYFEKKHPGSEVIASGWATHPQTKDDKVTGFQTVSVELWSEEERESYTVYLAVCLWDRRRTFVMDGAEDWYTEPTREEIAAINNNNEEENTMTTNTNTIQSTTDFEIEIQRSNITPAQFLAYVRSRVDAKGGHWYRSDLDLRWFKNEDSRWNCSYSFGLPGERGASSEVNKDMAYDKQTYILNFDGSVYNEIVEFDFDDEKTGHGYYYLVNKSAVPGCEESNKRHLIERAKRYFEREIERVKRKIAEKKEHLESVRQWNSKFWIEMEERDIRTMEMEIENRLDDIAECDEILGTAEAEAVHEAKFEIGNKYERTGLYGGSSTLEVVRRTETTVFFRSSWVSEDSWKLCHSEPKEYPIEVEKIGGVDVERVEIWEYRGAKGYIYAASEEKRDSFREEAKKEAEPAEAEEATEEEEQGEEIAEAKSQKGEYTMKKSMLTADTLDRFEEEFETEHYTEDKLRRIEYSAYVANMNKCAHPDWSAEDIFADFLRVLGIEKIENVRKTTEAAEITEEELDDAIAEEVEKEVSAEMKVDEILEKVEQTKTRSAWDRGVKEYALELLDNLGYGVRHGYIEADELENRRLLEKAMLNGASDWKQYSEGGCALCYDGKIAERLCAPWELRKTDNGRKDPNPRESWIDVQSRALYQAAQMILRVAF